MEYLISLYDALIGANVPPDKAKAVVQAMEREHVEKLATKSDLAAMKLDLEGQLKALELRLTLRLGAMLAASVGITVALLKAF